MIGCSVIICTYNPQPDYFARVLEGLGDQTLTMENWELLIVDNGSPTPLASRCDLSWHPNARHLVETEPGLSWARQRGIGEASADLIVFVDDDNVLDRSYLAEAIRVGREWPCLGVWGSGSIRGEFEVQPQERLISWLPIREVKTARWSNLAGSRIFGLCSEDAIPWGAGLCVRRAVAVAYTQLCNQSSMKITGRKGTSLTCCEDTEISFVCCSNGLGVGIFPGLKLTHLIPERRVTDDYIVRLAEGICLSNLLLQYKWQHVIPQRMLSMKTLLSLIKSVILYRGVDRSVRLAWIRALAKGNRMIKAELKKSNRQVSTYSALRAVDTLGDSGLPSEHPD